MKLKTTYDSAFVIGLSLLAHFLFSKYGFNPTDEGFVLSASNRLLHGQIPHVDFSSLRPLGYAYFHIIDLLFFKQHTFLFSRFIFWLENVLIAFFWVKFLLHYCELKLQTHTTYLFIFVAFVFNVHYFPCSVLHTIDGLLFAVMGLYFLQKPNRILQLFGAICIGFSILCKQGFLVMLPLSFLLLIDKRKTLLWAFVPIFIYVFIVVLNGGWADLKIQLGAHTELIEVGVMSYLTSAYMELGIIMAILFRYLKMYHLPYLFISFMLVFALCTFHYHGKILFLVSGFLIGEICTGILQRYNVITLFAHTQISATPNYSLLSDKYLSAAILAFVLSWAVSISVGYNTPALFTGSVLVFFIIRLNFKEIVLFRITTVILWIGILLVFIFARTHYIYRDNKSSDLHCNLKDVVKGGTGIYTNIITYKLLEEVDALKKTNHVVLLPDFTACAIKESHLSLIGTEWPNKTEIPNASILQKVISKLNTKDSQTVFCIAKYQTALVANKLEIIPNKGKDYPIIRWVKSNKQKIAETTFFELWK